VKTISMKYRFLLLALLPTLLVSVAISGFAIYETRNFGERNNSVFRDQMLELRRGEVRNYIQLAESTIDAYNDTTTLAPAAALETTKDIIRELNYGESGYFFINDYQGKNVVHGAKPSLEGKSLWNLKSQDDKYLIRDIDRTAKGGGGFTYYMWDKPGFEDPVEKITYVKTLDQWNWIIGAGLYLDDIETVYNQLNQRLDENLSQSIWVFLGLSTAALALAAGLFGRLSLKHGGATENELKILAEQLNRAQEHERQAIAAEIDDSVEEHLIGFRTRLPKLLDEHGVSDEIGAQLSARIDNAVRGIQRISHTLNPTLLEEHGLAYGLDILCKQFNDRGRLSVKLNQQGERSLRLPWQAEWETYRAIQDVLRLVEQSEGQGKVVVRGSFDQDAIQISLLEDSVGFDSKSISRNRSDMATLLLSSVTSRIEGVNGEVSVFGTKGTGTLLRIKFSLKKTRKQPQAQPAMAT